MGGGTSSPPLKVNKQGKHCHSHANGPCRRQISSAPSYLIHSSPRQRSEWLLRSNPPLLPRSSIPSSSTPPSPPSLRRHYRHCSPSLQEKKKRKLTEFRETFPRLLPAFPSSFYDPSEICRNIFLRYPRIFGNSHQTGWVLFPNTLPHPVLVLSVCRLSTELDHRCS